KVPRFNFEKFPHADPTLGTAMRSVGEVMALGRSFEEAFFKALRSTELGKGPLDRPAPGADDAAVLAQCARATPERPWWVLEALTPFLYSSWEREDEVPPPSGRPRVMILGSGPIRIGQGIEFDYCCVQASFALRAAGFDTVMVNCNPETVSTDWDTSSRLYFEPLTYEDVMNVLEVERPVGVIVGLGGQRPRKLAGP